MVGEVGCVMSREGIRSRAELKQWWIADQRAHGIDRWRFDSRFRHVALYYQRLLRTVEYLQTKRGLPARIARFYVRFRLNRLSVRTGITIPPNTFGPGLSIAHYGSIVVNTRAHIGTLCRIHSATNIGTANDGVPQIGNRVYIGPGAVIYGPIKIGDNAVIGANAVVNRDVPAGVTVAGSPAKVISNQGSAAVLPAWYPTNVEVGG